MENKQVSILRRINEIQELSPEFWKDSIVFVTGGTGFVGGELLKELVSHGCKVKALVRSEKTAKTIESMGAAVILGDVNDEEAWKKGCENSKIVFHLAAKVEIEGKLEEFMKITVEGTQLGLKVAKDQKPYPSSPAGLYPLTKGLQEQAVIKANDTKNDFNTVVLRPRLIWGKGDTVLLPKIGEAVQSGKWKWIGGGTHLTSTTHVSNVIEGLMKGAERGKGGEVYFITDGKPQEMKSFLGNYLEAGGFKALESGSLPTWFAKGLGFVGIVPKSFPYLMGEECTINDSKARKELGYSSRMSIEEGMKQFKDWVTTKNSPS